LWGLWGFFSIFLPRLSKNPQAAPTNKRGGDFNNHVIATLGAAERKTLSRSGRFDRLLKPFEFVS
jgi:hypothetical protein